MLHNYRAEVVINDGKKSIKITKDGVDVTKKVTFASTTDLRTCYARVGDMFIGGWQCAPKTWKRGFFDLVPSINAGVAFMEMDELPGKRHRKSR